MGTLTDKQQHELNALLEELDTLPTPELIVEAARLRLPVPMDEKSKKLMRQAYAGGIAAQKLLAYIEELRDVEDRRLKFGVQIHHKLKDATVWRAMRSLDAAQPLIEASQLAGRQEVMFHFFSVTVGRIERFLGIAAKAAGHKIPKEDHKLLATFRELRDYYEHMEDELPGRKNYRADEHEEEREGELRLRPGFTMDAQERIVLNGVTVDVSGGGLRAVEALLQRHWVGLRDDALDLVRKHFEADPSTIPPPEAVDQNLLVSVDGQKSLDR